MDFYEEEREKKFTELYEKKVEISEATPVQRFYENKTILITGGSGFVGKLLIEKLLRSCFNVKKLFLLMRTKKGKSIKERVRETFDDPLYEPMRSKYPNFYKKIEVISGSCEEEHMGMSKYWIDRVSQEVNIVFHCAATIRFDDDLKFAYNVNVNGTRNALLLAMKMTNLERFVYVSTAFSQSHRPVIEEKIYETLFTDKEMESLLDQLDDSTINILTPKILDQHFNTYTMTKALAERLIGQYRDKLPLTIFRPSIITSTYEEPLKSWASGIFGATGVIIGAALGFLRTLLCDPDSYAEIIPADRTTNLLICIPYNEHLKRLQNEKQSSAVSVYNYLSKNKITWGDLMVIIPEVNETQKEYLKTSIIMWEYHLSLDKNYYVWVVKYYLKHLLPLPFFLILEKLSKQPPRILKAYIRLYHYTALYSFFTLKSWIFETGNVDKLEKMLSPEDAIVFNVGRVYNWNKYFYWMSRGIGKHVLKTDWNEEQRKNQWKLDMVKLLDKILIMSLHILKYWMIYKGITCISRYWLHIM